MNKRLMPLWIVAALGVGFFAGRWTLPGHAGDAPPPPPIDADVKVVRISSGDSVEVSSLRHTDVHDKVRLIGIDAPASGKRWYEQSSRSLAELVKDKEVHLEFEEPGRVQRAGQGQVGIDLFSDLRQDLPEGQHFVKL